jgi:4-diphosphocytidyl-2-C-methyl-D-erythritol kinase
VIVFPNCKINLGLRIISKRDDGYHDLETIFYPLPFYDALEIIRSKEDGPSVLFSASGTVIEGNKENNLCVKAYDLIKKIHPSLPTATIHLHKAIPSGAGLGGGSADAAFTLQLLNTKFDLALSTDQLISYALQLGSDCPFFIVNKPCFATGRGEILQEIILDLPDYKFVVVNPGIHISTAQAFDGITPAPPARSVKEIIQQPVETWKAELINDFEKNIFIQHPEIATIKNKLYDNGAIYASMSGSGSTVYGIFKKNAVVDLRLPENYFIKELIN